MTMRFYIWMIPCASLPLSERSHREGEWLNEPIVGIAVN